MVETIENVEAIEQAPVLTDYETERGKPMPSKLHSLLTKRLSFILDNKLQGKFEAFPELTLEALNGQPFVPDIAVCEVEPIDFNQDEIKRKTPPTAIVEILSPTQPLQILVDKTNDYFSFGVKSCWIVLPILQSIVVFHAPHTHEVYSHRDELYDPNLDIRIPIDLIFSSTAPLLT